MRNVLLGQTDYSVLVKIALTTGAPATGLTEASIDLAYTRLETDNDVTVTDVTPAALSALTDAHTDWGFEEVHATDAPGLYRLDIADAVFATGAWEAVVTITDASGTDFYAHDIGFRLVADNPQTATFDTVESAITSNFGFSNGNVNANVAEISTDSVAADRLETMLDGTGGNAFTATFTGNLTGSVASVTAAVTCGTLSNNTITAASIAADAITAAKIADGAIDAATFAAGAINAAAIAADAITDAKVAADVTIASVTGAVGSVTGNVGGNVAGSVGSVTGAVGSVTGNVGGNVAGSVASVTAAVTITGDAATLGTRLLTAIELDGAVYRFTTNALEQAPAGGGGSADWTADEKTAIKTILGVPASGTTPDEPTAGALKVIDDFLDTEIAAIKAKTDTIVGGTFTLTSPVSAAGNISLVRGDSYYNADGRALTFTLSSAPSITGAAVTLELAGNSYSGTVSSSTVCYFELTSVETAALLSDSYNFHVDAVLSNGHEVTLVTGTATVT